MRHMSREKGREHSPNQPMIGLTERGRWREIGEWRAREPVVVIVMVARELATSNDNNSKQLVEKKIKEKKIGHG